jgi:hypothetical protein
MKKVLLWLFAVIIVFAVLAGAGFAGYRVGYDQGARASGNDNIAPNWLSENRGSDEIRGFNFGTDNDGRHERAFDRGFPRGYFRMMPHGRGFGIFSLVRLLTHLAVWALVIGLVYLLFTRSGWRLSLTKQPVQGQPATIEPIETEAKPQDPKNE